MKHSHPRERTLDEGPHPIPHNKRGGEHGQTHRHQRRYRSDVIERYRDTVFRLAFTYLRNQADADDVTQDVFVKLIRSSHDFESDEHLRRWLIRVTINECKSLFRKPWRRIDDIEDYANTIAMPTPEHTDLFVRVMNLPERYRVPLVLYYLGFSTNETANLLKIPAATVRTRLARGRSRLKSMLEEEDYVSEAYVQRGHESAARL